MFGRIKDFTIGVFVSKLGYNMKYSEMLLVRKKHNQIVIILAIQYVIIMIQFYKKGDGYKIYEDDTIALICEECKKVYGFNDSNSAKLSQRFIGFRRNRLEKNLFFRCKKEKNYLIVRYENLAFGVKISTVLVK